MGNSCTIKSEYPLDKLVRVCEFPDCTCEIPDYAFSHQVRIKYCNKMNEEKESKK